MLKPITPDIQDLLEKAEALAARLRILKKYAHQEREKGLQICQIHVNALFEDVDNKALEDWEDLVRSFTGPAPLLEAM